MKIVIAPQAFKGSVSALEVAQAMEEGVQRVIANVETILVPVADGGDGTLETLVEASNGKIHTSTVTGPLGRPVTASWGAMGDGNTAIIEMARTSGLALIPIQKRDPMITTTYGLGEVIKQALDDGFRNYIIGIGGSATNDAGAGMAQALGIRLLDNNSTDISFGGGSLSNLSKIDMAGLDPRISESKFSVACDVNNPLTGSEGASSVYGPQKGATPAMIKKLDAALNHMAKIVERDIGLEINNVPGSGAAGGLGGGLIAFLNGTLKPGVDIVLTATGLFEQLNGADLVITGEGCLDYQTVYDKAPIGVAKMAKLNSIPVIAISGSLGERHSEVYQHGIDAASSIIQAPMSLDEASTQAYELIASATEQAIRLMQIGVPVFKIAK